MTISRWEAETRDMDIHQAICETGWWNQELKRRIAEKEARLGRKSTPGEVLRETLGLLTRLASGSMMMKGMSGKGSRSPLHASCTLRLPKSAYCFSCLPKVK